MLLEEALRACRSAHHARLVLLTARREDDPQLLRVRRSGAGYVILRPAPLAHPEWALRFRGREVFVPAHLSPPASGACTLDLIAEAAIAAAVEWEPGSIRAIGCWERDAWVKLIRAAGGSPRVAPAWRIAWARVVGDVVLTDPEEKERCRSTSTGASTVVTSSSSNDVSVIPPSALA